RVPDEVALVSLGDAEFHEYLNVPMTAVAADHRAMAAAVVERLLAQIRDPRTPPKHIWVKPHLVVRASSRQS
ncbi:MAG: substrate-binding domain-containing protein, partial [Verrucomicrobia bacterium]|nr:substrate-binding domain-containing protein [Verrucomicrobiota bacterium]